jgi:hypothetical protein
MNPAAWGQLNNNNKKKKKKNNEISEKCSPGK